jgi:peptidoglycan L-alanyl-D-glutamate endopeptidase CwlK
MGVKYSYNDIIYLQRSLRFFGFYDGEIDGLYGPITTKAVENFHSKSFYIKSEIGQFDPISEKHIITLHPKLQELSRRFLLKANYLDIADDTHVRIISGTRTYEEQAALYAKGRDSSGKITNKNLVVTNAKPGQSMHNFSVAYDIAIIKKGYYVDNDEIYNLVYEKCKVDGLDWGGNWTEFVDRPHYQLHTDLSVSKIKKQFETGVKFQC